MYNPQYGMGGEIGSDPVMDVFWLIAMMTIFLLAMWHARHWIARDPSYGRDGHDPR